MSINRSQIVVLSFGALLFLGLYSFMRTVPNNKKGAPTADLTQAVNDQSIILEAKQALDSNQVQILSALELQQAQAPSIKEEVETLKEFSKQWNQWNNYAVGGYYAEKIAELMPTDEAWAIAGSTFGIAFQKTKDIQIQQYAARKAVKAYEAAIALAPDSVSYKINEALMYVELSAVDNTVPPMTGALKLLELDKAYPNNLKINFALANLSMLRSGDYKKALDRLEKIILFPNIDTLNLIDAHYMMVACHQELNQINEALLHYDKCIALAAFDTKLQNNIKERKAIYMAAVQNNSAPYK